MSFDVSQKLVLQLLRQLRRLPADECLSYIYVVCGLWRSSACPTLFSADVGSIDPVFCSRNIAVCVDTAGILGLPEVHLWTRRKSMDHLPSDWLLNLPKDEWVLSLPKGQRFILNHFAQHSVSPLRRYSEVLFCCSTDGGDLPKNSQPSGPPQVCSMRDDQRPFRQSGAYPEDVIRFLTRNSVDAYVWTDDAGQWLSRCYLMPRDFAVAEICGLETRPDHRGRGFGSGLLTAVVRAARLAGLHVIYLTHSSNKASIKTAQKAGFRMVQRYSKYRIST